jgi:hypothetical protein
VLVKEIAVVLFMLVAVIVVTTEGKVAVICTSIGLAENRPGVLMAPKATWAGALLARCSQFDSSNDSP